MERIIIGAVPMIRQRRRAVNGAASPSAFQEAVTDARTSRAPSADRLWAPGCRSRRGHS